MGKTSAVKSPSQDSNLNSLVSETVLLTTHAKAPALSFKVSDLIITAVHMWIPNFEDEHYVDIKKYCRAEGVAQSSRVPALQALSSNSSITKTKNKTKTCKRTSYSLFLSPPTNDT
jgi:hypothetical protein